MTELTTAWMLGCVCGFFIGVTAASRRRPTCRELMRDRDHRPSGPPPLRLDPGRVQRSNGGNSPTTPKPDITPKPQFPSPRTIREDFLP